MTDESKPRPWVYVAGGLALLLVILVGLYKVTDHFVKHSLGDG